MDGVTSGNGDLAGAVGGEEGRSPIVLPFDRHSLAAGPCSARHGLSDLKILIVNIYSIVRSIGTYEDDREGGGSERKRDKGGGEHFVDYGWVWEWFVSKDCR